MFFSLEQSVTKNQILNTKCQPKLLFVISIEKEKMTASLFDLKQQKNNEKNITYQNITDVVLHNIHSVFENFLPWWITQPTFGYLFYPTHFFLLSIILETTYLKPQIPSVLSLFQDKLILLHENIAIHMSHKRICKRNK